MKITNIIVSLVAALVTPALAQNSQEAIERSLKIILEFSLSMCANPEYRGATTSVEASATAKAEVNRLVRKLVDAKVELDASAKREGFEGLLQKDLLEATKVASSCRLKLFDELKGRLLPSTGRDQSSVSVAHYRPITDHGEPIKPSYDCERASNRVERLVCATAGLAILDLSMANSYRDVMAEQRSVTDRQEWKESQNYWLRRVRDLCPDEDCLALAYKQRIEELRHARR